jgi:aminoglycoside 6'-N-acetyltransferase
VEITITPSRRRRGFATDALSALVRGLSDGSRIQRLEAQVPADEDGIATCFERAGFRQVGLLRRSMRDAKGVWRDSILLEQRLETRAAAACDE